MTGAISISDNGRTKLLGFRRSEKLRPTPSERAAGARESCLKLK